MIIYSSDKHNIITILVFTLIIIKYRWINRDWLSFILNTGKFESFGTEIRLDPARMEYLFDKSLITWIIMKRTEHWIDFNLHDIEYNDSQYLEQAMNEGIPALMKLKEQGKIRFFGIATYPIQVIREVIELHDIDTVMNHNLFTLNDTRLLSLLPLIRDKNIGLMNSAPLGSGLLTARGVASWHSAGEEEKAIVNKAVEFCIKQGTSIEKLAIQFSVSCEDIPTTLVSTANPERIKMNAEYVEDPMDNKLVEKVQEILKPIRNKDWDDFNKQDSGSPK